jgi:quercetin dioxygenase-like cupin family protein
MRIVRAASEGRKPSADAIFIGSVDTQMLVGDGKDLRIIEVHFKGGARNRRHTHTTDQLLIVTDGTGIVAAGTEEHEVHPGDIAFIPSGEVHWHGAKPGHDMTHLAINGGTSETSIKE